MKTGLAETAEQGVIVTGEIDPGNFDEICRVYGEKVLNLAFRMTGDSETARDLTQDIFLKVYQNLDSFKHESNLFTWIYRIAMNHILNYLKRERRFRWLDVLDKSVSDLIQEDQSEAFSWSKPQVPHPDELVESKERETIIWKLINSLPAKYRVPLILNRYEELSYQEIADTLGLSLSAVETRIHRGKKKLISKLKPWLPYL